MEPPVSPEVVEQLKANAREWVETDATERQLRDRLKAISARKKELGDSILTGLEAVQKTEIGLLSGGRLKYATSKTYAPLKQEQILAALRDELGDGEKAGEIVDKLYASREEKTTVTLRRLKR